MARNIRNKVTGSLDTITTYDSTTGDITGLTALGNVALGDVANVSILGGANGEVLTTDGSGNLSWSAAAADVYGVPAVYFVVPTTANNQTFSNTLLAAYTSNLDMTVFFNGALLENDAYTLSGDTLTVNTPLSTGDSIDIIRQFAGNVNNVSGSYGNSNVVALMEGGFGGNIVPSVNVLYSLGNATNQWKDLYVSNATIYMNNVPLSANSTGLSYGNQQLVTTSSSGNIATTGNVTSNGTVTGNTVVATGTLTAANANISGNLSVNGTSTFQNIVVQNSANIANATLDGTVSVLSALTTDDITSRTGDLTLSATGTNQNITLDPSGTGYVDVSSSLIKNIVDPVDPQDAATKAYVDAFAQGLQAKQSVTAATATDLATLTGGTVTYNNGASGVGATLTLSVALTTLDGVSLANGDRLLIKNETSQADNGIYTWATGGTVLTRALDYDTPTDISAGSFVLVEQGTLYASTGWVEANDVVTVGTDPIAFNQFSQAGSYTAGAGLTLTGSQFSITDTTVTAGTYGNATEAVTLAVNSRGQITSISQQPMAASYGNADVSAYLNSGTNTDGFSTSGDIAANNIIADGGLSSAGPASYFDDVTAYANMIIGVDLAVQGNQAVYGNFTVLGRTSLGVVSNVAIAGGTAGDVLTTDGSGGLSWTVPSTYGNSNVADYLGSGTSLNYVSTGNITARNVTFQRLTATLNANLGNVENVSILGGTAGQVLTTNGSNVLSWANGYNNASVSTYLASNTNTAGFATQGTISAVGNITSSGNIVITGNINSSRLTATVITATNQLAAGSVIGTVGVSTANLTATGNTALANLTATKSNLGAVGNITITGGSNGQVLTTNGSGNLSWQTPLAAGTYQATASSNMAAGDKIIINTDGTVSVAFSQDTVNGSYTNMVTNSVNNPTSVYDASTGKIVFSYVSSGGIGTSIVGTVSGTTITYGSPQTISANSIYSLSTVYDPTTQQVIYFYRDDTNGNKMTAQTGKVNGPSSTMTFGTPVVVLTTATDNGPSFNKDWITAVSYDTANQKVVVSFRNGALSGAGSSCVGTVSGTTISFGTIVAFTGNSIASLTSTYDSVNQKIVVGWSPTNFGYCAVGTVSGTSISFGSPITVTGSSNVVPYLVFDPSAERVLFVFVVQLGGGLNVRVGQVNGTDIGFGSQYTISSGQAGSVLSATYDSYAKLVVFVGQNVSGGTPLQITYTGKVSGTAVTIANGVTGNRCRWVMATYDPVNNYSIIGCSNDTTNPAIVQAKVYRPPIATNLTANNFLGISAGTYANGTRATIQTIGGVNTNQSGLIPGSQYYLISPNTLSTTPGTPNVYVGLAVSPTDLIVKG